MRRLCLLAALLSTTACHQPTATSDIRVSIIDRSWALGDTTVSIVRFAVVNSGADVVYLPRCGAEVLTAVERAAPDGTWINSSASICIAVAPMDPIRLDPGAQLTSQASVHGHGRFRLLTGSSPAVETEMSWTVYSAAFDIP